MSGKKNFLPEKINSSKGNYTIDGTVCSLRNSVSAMPFHFLAFVAFGTRNPLLRYGIDTRCQKRHPTVRDAFSEALRAQNRLLGYGREIRYQKHPPPVRGAVRPSYGTGCSSSFRGALHRKPPSGVWNEAIGCDRCVADPLLPTTFVNYAGKLHNEGCHSIGSLR